MSNVSLHRSMTFINTKCKRAASVIFASMLLFFVGNAAHAAVTVTPALGGTNICHNSAANGTLPAYTALGTITVQEGLTGDFAGFLSSIVITAPAGWQFNTGAAPTISNSGGDILASFNGGFTTTSLTVDFFVLGTARRK